MKDQKELPAIMTLHKVRAHEIWVSNEDGTSSHIKAIYRDERIALIDAKGSDAWGGDAKVYPEDLFIDDNNNIYRVENLGKFTDEDRKYKDEVVKKIKGKLSQAEIDFLGL